MGTYEHYYGDKKYQSLGSDHHGYAYAHDYYKKGGYLCPSDIYYGRPKRAVNTYGKWKVIVNLPEKYYSQCLQKHNFVRLLAYTHDQGLHIDSFKMPVACSCHISEPHHFVPGYKGTPASPVSPAQILIGAIGPPLLDGARRH